MFSPTVSSGTRLNSWYTVAIPWRKASRGLRQPHRTAVDENLSARGLHRTGEDLYQGALAGPVLSQQGVNAAAGELQRHAGQRRRAGIDLPEIEGLQFFAGHESGQMKASIP